MGNDVRFSLRSLLQAPGFCVTAILSLAFGIAATTTIFSVIYGVIIDPFPYAHPETLMSMFVREPSHNLVFYPFTPEHYLDLAERSHVFDGVIASTISDVNLTGIANPERLRGNFVTVNTFDVLGVQPQLGRSIRPSDGSVEAAPVVVLGYKFWQRHFGGDPSVLGANLRLNNKVRTVVGVMPPRFMWRGADVYLPIVFQRGKVVEDVRYINVIGRLKPGVTAAAAATDLHPIFQDILLRDPAYHRESFRVTLNDFYETYPSSIRKQLWTLLTTVSLLLIIACANVSNLMLARAAARSREIAMRVALGAGRLRIVRQLLTESLLLGLASAAAGALLALGMLQAVIAIIPPGTIPDESKVSLNIPVLLFTLGVSLLTVLLSGSMPAFRASRADLAGTLRGSGRGFAGNLQEGRLRKLLVAGEVSLAMLLLIGASLVLRTLIKLQDLNLGYQTSSVLSMQVPLLESRYATIDARNQFLASILERIRALPGANQVALNTFAHPFADWGMQVEAPGSSVHRKQPAIFSQINEAYPALLHIPLQQGRFFSGQEVSLKRHVALVNEKLARLYFGDSPSAVGRQLRLPELKGEPIRIADDAFTIVGVVADVRNTGLTREIYPEVYVPYTTTGFMEAFIHPMLLLSAQMPVKNLANAVEQQIHALDPDQPVMRVQTVEKLLDEEGLAGPRFSVFLFGLFAALGLTICLIGIYGVVNYSVSRQMQALGVRLALGADRANILGLVLREAFALIFAGVLVGAGCGLVATRWLGSLLWGVSPSDPFSFAIVALVLLAAGLAATLRPAWRACRVDPMLVLRHE